MSAEETDTPQEPQDTQPEPQEPPPPQEPAAPAPAPKKKDDDEGWVGLVVLAMVIGVAGLIVNAVRSPRPPASPTPTATQPRPAQPKGRKLGVYFEVSEGFLVVHKLYEGGPAEQAGMRQGDRVLSIDGTKIEVPDGEENPIGPAKPIHVRLAALRRGEGVTLQIQRQLEDGSYAPAEPLKIAFEGKGFELALSKDLIRAGVAQLVSARRADGWWPHYHLTKDKSTRPSAAVSSLVAYALRRAEPLLSEEQRAIHGRLLDQLVEARGEDGGVVDPAHLAQHRVYATSLTLRALLDTAGKPAARHAEAVPELRAWLARAQVQESSLPVGYEVVDRRYGGWSYYDDFASDGLRTDVSTASYALVALADAGLPADDPAWQRASLFLDVVHNFALTTPEGDPLRPRERELRDGGFATMPRTSKAQSVTLGGALRIGGSYGSATADGLLGLLAVRGIDLRRTKEGPLPADERVLAALRWLAKHHTLEKNPGFEPDPVGWGEGLFFYSLASRAEALHRAGVATIKGSDGTQRAWAAELVTSLGFRHGKRHQTFGSDSRLMHEDRPTIASAFALIALAAARDRLALGGGSVLVNEAPPRAPSLLHTDPPLPAADAMGRGRQLFAARCTACHSKGALAGPDLARVADKYLEEHGDDLEKSQTALEAFLEAPSQDKALLGWSKSKGKPTMFKVPLTPKQRSDLATWLLNR